MTGQDEQLYWIGTELHYRGKIVAAVVPAGGQRAGRDGGL